MKYFIILLLTLVFIGSNYGIIFLNEEFCIFFCMLYFFIVIIYMSIYYILIYYYYDANFIYKYYKFIYSLENLIIYKVKHIIYNLYICKGHDFLILFISSMLKISKNFLSYDRSIYLLTSLKLIILMLLKFDILRSKYFYIKNIFNINDSKLYFVESYKKNFNNVNNKFFYLYY